MAQIKSEVKVNILTGPCKLEIKDPAVTFRYTCDEFQKHAMYCISQGEHVLVTAHTGSGKTSVAEYAIAHTFLVMPAARIFNASLVFATKRYSISGCSCESCAIGMSP